MVAVSIVVGGGPVPAAPLLATINSMYDCSILRDAALPRGQQLLALRAYSWCFFFSAVDKFTW